MAFVQLGLTVFNSILLIVSLFLFFFLPLYFLTVLPIIFIISISALILFVLVIWLFIDLFLIPKYIKQDNEYLRRKIEKEVISYRQK